jgi:gamma-glutamylaminecyclotransferase
MGYHLVFVYGTLKSGHVRSAALRGQRYIGIARTAPNYTMFQYGSYPALVESVACEGAVPQSIFGELYEVDDACMMELDKIEGIDAGLFDRKQVSLDTITLANLPVDETVWKDVARKKAMSYAFKKLDKLTGARDCGSMWFAK